MKQKTSTLFFLAILTVVFIVPVAHAGLFKDILKDMIKGQRECDDTRNRELTSAVWVYLLNGIGEFQEENFKKLKSKIKEKSIHVSKQTFKQLRESAMFRDKYAFYHTFNLNIKINDREAIERIIFYKLDDRSFVMAPDDDFSGYSICDLRRFEED